MWDQQLPEERKQGRDRRDRRDGLREPARRLAADELRERIGGEPEDRGRSEDPWWSRPGLIVVGVFAGVLVSWALTASGYANNWYAGGALAASRSWKALFENAADLSGMVSLDKGPLSEWMMGLSGRIFGFSSFSMLLPDTLCGIASVILLVAANGSQAAAPIALATGAPVITMGGFSESGTVASVPAPTVDQLKALIARGELRYVIPGPRSFAPARTGWVESHCAPVTAPATWGLARVSMYVHPGGRERLGEVTRTSSM